MRTNQIQTIADILGLGAYEDGEPKTRNGKPWMGGKLMSSGWVTPSLRQKTGPLVTESPVSVLELS